jgi:hypothetical protein
MFKKILLVIAGLTFGLGVLAASAYRNSERVLAQKIGSEEEKIKAEDVGEKEATLAAEKVVLEKVDYVLPYPGILPDNKLYFLKMLRDKIWRLLIVGENKKIDWLVLMGDKRLAAGKVLIDTGLTGLGVTTIIKGEKYLAEAVSLAETAKIRNINVYDQLEHLRKSILKHREILEEEVERIEGGKQGSLQELIEPLEERYKKINQLLGREEEERVKGVEKAEEGELTSGFGEE